MKVQHDSSFQKLKTSIDAVRQHRHRRISMKHLIIGVAATFLLYLLTIYTYPSIIEVSPSSIRHIVSTAAENRNLFHVLMADSQPSNVAANSAPASILNDKWIVVTSISSPTEQIKTLSQIPGWKLLVIADKKTPANWTYPNSIFLDIETQLQLGYRVLEFLPWNAYTRKVIGYIYAIEHGAQFIYDTDDDNAPNDPGTFERDFVFAATTRGLIINNNGSESESVVTNPYVHFGQPSVWPRGYPLELIGQVNNRTTYTACPMRTPLIQQGIVNGDPDVDAIYRLTRKKLHSALNILFDGAAPPLVLPDSLLAPFNSQNTIFHYDAFWGLLLPVSVAFRVTDIWRGYWAQALLWRVGGHLGFYPPRTTQIRNPHKYLRDFGDEDQMYKQAGLLSAFLAEWECLREDLYGCLVELSSVMANQNFWSFDEVKLAEAWISDLKMVGYKEPALRYDPFPCFVNKNQAIAIFNGVEISTQDSEADGSDTLREFCNFAPNETKRLNQNQSENSFFPETLLIITFNIPHYENIWLLDSIYRPHYPNILYCGHLTNVSILYNFLESKNFSDAKVQKISFVHANIENGYFAYECAIRAIDMKYSVSGFIVLSDDILFNFWNNIRFDAKEMWMLNDVGILNTELPTNSTGWMWWGFEIGLNATKMALSRIYDPNMTNPYVIKFRNDRDAFGFNSSCGMVSQSDIFYLPQSKQDMFYEIASILRECRVFLEISVPFLVTGLSSPEKLVHMPGIYLWGGGRERPFDYFNPNSSVIHPVKPSQVISNQNLTNEFCKHYVKQVIASK